MKTAAAENNKSSFEMVFLSLQALEPLNGATLLHSNNCAFCSG